MNICMIILGIIFTLFIIFIFTALISIFKMEIEEKNYVGAFLNGILILIIILVLILAFLW